MGVRMKTGTQGATNVVPTPTGSTREIGSETTETGSYKEIVSYTPEDGRTFALSKILVTWTGDNEQFIVVKVDGEIVSEYFSAAYVMDWFPPGVDMVGDGVKKVLIEAKAVSTPATLIGFIGGQVT